MTIVNYTWVGEIEQMPDMGEVKDIMHKVRLKLPRESWMCSLGYMCTTTLPYGIDFVRENGQKVRGVRIHRTWINNPDPTEHDALISLGFTHDRS